MQRQNKVQDSKEDGVHIFFSDMLCAERTLPFLVRSLRMRGVDLRYAKELSHALGTVDVTASSGHGTNGRVHADRAAILRSRMEGMNSAVQTILGFCHLFFSGGRGLLFLRVIEEVYDLGVIRLFHLFGIHRIVRIIQSVILG